MTTTTIETTTTTDAPGFLPEPFDSLPGLTVGGVLAFLLLTLGWIFVKSYVGKKGSAAAEKGLLAWLRRPPSEPEEPVTPERLMKLRQLIVGQVRDEWVSGDRAPLEALRRQHVRWIDPALRRDRGLLHPVRLEGRRVSTGDRLVIDDGLDIADVFNKRLDRSVLVTGGPGAGKSVWLWRLCARLTTLAEDDEAEPVPVIIELHRWAIGTDSIRQFVIDELAARGRNTPAEAVKRWLDAQDALVLLFDGLDELKDDELIGDCVDKLNLHIDNHPNQAIAVTTRPDDYKASFHRAGGLQVKHAVTLQPLDDDQRNELFGRVSPALDGVRAKVEAGQGAWSELARVPLWWTVMAVVCRRLGEGQLPDSDRDETEDWLYRRYLDDQLAASSWLVYVLPNADSFVNALVQPLSNPRAPQRRLAPGSTATRNNPETVKGSEHLAPVMVVDDEVHCGPLRGVPCGVCPGRPVVRRAV